MDRDWVTHSDDVKLLPVMVFLTILGFDIPTSCHDELDWINENKYRGSIYQPYNNKIKTSQCITKIIMGTWCIDINIHNKTHLPFLWMALAFDTHTGCNVDTEVKASNDFLGKNPKTAITFSMYYKINIWKKQLINEGWTQVKIFLSLRKSI